MPNQDQEEIPRRRGRPTGKNRVPLSAEERRARNAQYERERRNDYAEAMLDLAVAAGCESGISNPELLATVINQIQRATHRNSSKDIEELKRINENLESQIASLTERLENDSESCEMPAAKKYKLSETSELRTDAEPQTSNCFYNPDERAAPVPNKRINKLKKGKELKVRKQSTTVCNNNQPHTAIGTLPVTWFDAESSQTSEERSESESPEPQSPHTEIWSEESNSTLTTDSENCALPIGVEIESDKSDGTSHTQTELHERPTHDQVNQLEPLAMQWTQYNPPPDLAPEALSQSEIYFQLDQLNIPEIQHTPDSESITDLFNDEKGLLTEWINCSSDLFRTDSYDSGVPVRQWSIDDFLTL